MAAQATCLENKISSEKFAKLAEDYGTPFFLYDADAVNDRIHLILDSFEHLVKVFYAVKANPNLELLRSVRDTADGLDISSGGELEQSVLAGFNMADLSFAGPAKKTEELVSAIEHGVGCISIESIRELIETVEIAKRLGVKASITVRINPLLMIRSFGMKMGGKPIQFGIDEESLSPVLKIIQENTEHLDFQGIHIYAGSQCFDISGIVAGVENTLRIAHEIESGTGLTCRKINLGGGFGVSHGGQNHELNIAALAEKLVPILRAFHSASAVEREIIFELGRFLTADAGIYITRVVSSKESRGKSFFMVDGGLHHHLAAAGMFGTALRSNYPLRNLSRREAPLVTCSIAGPSCNPTDLLGIDVEIPQPEYGDLIGILKSGSYGFTASPLLFLGRQTPAELILHNGKVILGRRSRTMVNFN